MSIHEHLAVFDNKNVEDFDPLTGINRPTGVAYRIAQDWDDDDSGDALSGKLQPFLDAAGIEKVEAIVIGMWAGAFEQSGNSAPIVEQLVAARDRLKSLRAIFLGDIIGEECEISWIRQSDLSALWAAFPRLREFRVRGSDGLSLGQMRLPELQTLGIECGGLPTSILREVASAELPELIHLELFLGDDGYGWDGTSDDLQPFLACDQFPKLKHLGLRDSKIADEVAMMFASAPILERIDSFDLSLGTLGDEGVAALLESPHVRKLKSLDIHHHFVSPKMVERIKGLGINVNAQDPQKAEEWNEETYRYVAVSE